MRPMLMIAFALPILAAGGCAATRADPSAPRQAEAVLRDAKGQPAGRAYVRSSADGVWVDVQATGLTPGAHGLHIHAVGACAAPDFASAGPHWNPAGHQHGRKNPAGAHAGDAPNLMADAKGRGRLKIWLPGSLTGSGQALLDGDGAAVVIHADPDDEMTDPSGKSGKRILCGVLAAR